MYDDRVTVLGSDYCIVNLVYMLPALCGPAVFNIRYIRFWLFLPQVFSCMDRVHFISIFAFRRPAWLYLCYNVFMLLFRGVGILSGGGGPFTGFLGRCPRVGPVQ